MWARSWRTQIVWREVEPREAGPGHGHPPVERDIRDAAGIAAQRQQEGLQCIDIVGRLRGSSRGPDDNGGGLSKGTNLRFLAGRSWGLGCGLLAARGISPRGKIFHVA